MNRSLESVALALVALSGCADTGQRPAAGRENTITIICDPGLCGSPWGDSRGLLFLPLVTPEWLPAAEARPALAERWEHSADYREWTIHLRPGVRWHDGHPVTAHDIEFTMRLWAHPDVMHQNHVPFESVTVLDDLTIQIRYSNPSRAPLDGEAVPYPRHVLENLDPSRFSEWEFWRQPTVGNGPYRLARHHWESVMELEANPDYYAGTPRIPRVVVKYAAPMATHLLSGEVDVIRVIDQATIPGLLRDPRFKVYYQTIPYARVQILWNQRHEPLRDSAVRQALTMALDRRELHRALNLPEGLALTDGIFTAGQYRRGELVEPLPYDREAARALLEAAGWIEGRDGVRECDGIPLVFHLLVSSGPYLGQPAQAAVLIQEQLRQVGARVDIETREVQATLGRVRAGEFQAAIWSSAVSRDAEFFGRGSPLGYANPRVIELLDATTLNPDLAARDRAYRELATIFRRDIPATFLYPKVDAHAVHRRVRGLESPYRGEPFWFLPELWLDPTEPR